ncbi:unnamed protein product, partial [Mesorhabditis spiculigera]
MYHLGLSGGQQKHFDQFATYINTNVERLPIIFMLGFFVTLVVNRWQKIYESLGWIEDTALLMSCLIHGDDEETILARRAIRLREKIPGDPSLQSCVQEVKRFRDFMQTLSNYDWVPVPLAYPQVVFFAFLNIYFPLTTSLQFVFYIGWMKVAESLLNPLGEDDDDFETNYLLDKNISTAMAIVDSTSQKHPPLIRDRFYHHKYLPGLKDDEEDIVGSVAHLKMPNDEPRLSISSIRQSIRSLRKRIQPEAVDDSEISHKI